jgi:hypothetical protein
MAAVSRYLTKIFVKKILIHHPNAVRSVIRIKYFRRFLLFAPNCLVSLTAFYYSTNPERSWLGLVFSDLLWMRSKCFTLKDFPSPFDDFSPWREFILDKPAMFFSLCSNSLDDSAFDEHPKMHDLPDNDPTEVLTCNICKAEFPSKQCLASHNWISHSRKNPIRRKISGTRCQSCHTEFHTRTKLLNHVACRVHKCNLYYSNLPDLGLELYEQLETQESQRIKKCTREGDNRNFYPIPCCRVRASAVGV